MIRLLALGLIVFIVIGCSSAPDKSYEVTTYKDISTKLMGFADRKRQEAHYGDAIELYLEAEKYAIKRNDKYLLGLSQLKRSSIAIVQGRQTEASLLLAEVENMVRFEQVDLKLAIDFVKAKMAAAIGDTLTAKALFKGLEKYYSTDEQAFAQEKQIYYRLQGWSLDYQGLSAAQVEADISTLRELYQAKQLNNVEIFSFALMSYLTWQVANQSSTAPDILTEALAHFATLELSNKTAECYLLGAEYYQSQGDKQKAEYYQAQASKINLVL